MKMEGLIMARKNSKDKGIFEQPKGSGTWWVIIYVNGIRKRWKVGSKSSARAFYQKLKVEAMENRLFPEKYERKRVMFSELAKDRLSYVAANHSRAHDDDHRVKRWNDSFQDLDASQITPSMIENVLAEMKKEGLALATLNRHLMVLKAIFSRAIRDGLLLVNPAAKIKQYKPNNEIVRYLTPQQEVSLFECLSITYHPIVRVGINTGIRQGELLRLTWDDVDWNTGILTVKKSKHGQVHRVPMNSIVQRVLTESYKNRKSGRIFPHDSSQMRKSFEKAIKQAGLAPFRFHDLRHTFASRLAMKGVNDRTLMVLGGWKSSAMLSRYAHLSPTHLWQAVEGLVEVKSDIETEQPLKQPLSRKGIYEK